MLRSLQGSGRTLRVKWRSPPPPTLPAACRLPENLKPSLRSEIVSACFTVEVQPERLTAAAGMHPEEQ